MRIKYFLITLIVGALSFVSYPAQAENVATVNVVQIFGTIDPAKGK